MQLEMKGGNANGFCQILREKTYERIKREKDKMFGGRT